MSTVKQRFEGMLQVAAQRGLSDVHLKVGQPPLFRRAGRLISRKDAQVLDAQSLEQMVEVVLTKERLQLYAAGHDITTTYGLVGVGRFRVQVYRQRGVPAFSARLLPAAAQGLAALQLPQTLANWVLGSSGLVLVCSGASHGRSTTLAGLIEVINTQSSEPRHLATIEAPIGVYHDDKLAWITQREVGVDCATFASGVAGSTNQDTDIIAADGPADPAAWEALIAAAEAGKLVIATLRTGGLVPGLRRLVTSLNVEPARLAGVFAGACATHLLPSPDGKRHVPAVEFLSASPVVASILQSGVDYDQLFEQMAGPMGQTFERSLQQLMGGGRVSADAARQFTSFRLT